MFDVCIVDGEGKRTHYRFNSHSIILGRSVGSDIQLDVQGVSRYHARIVYDQGSISVSDLGSTNGTFVGEQRVEHAILRDDSVIVIGELRISVRWDDVHADSEDDNTQGDSSGLPAASPIVESQTVEELTEQENPAPDNAVGESPAPASVKQADAFYWQSLERFLQPIWRYITDPSISEIMVNGPDEIFIERKGKLLRTETVFNPHQLQAAVLNIAQFVGRRVDEDEPYMDARLPDGSRVAILLPPCSRKGISIAIRKFSTELLTTELLLQFGSLSREMLTFIEACVVLKKNIIISGGTSSGKTSLLNALSGLIPADERIITIEDSAELQLHQDHVLPMETKPPDKKGRGQITIRDLVRASLRMRPDRIVVGEIRGGEALDLLQAMNTGHSGSMATVHASSPAQAMTRLETLALFSGLEIPMRALREQVSTAIDFVIQASRLPDHSRKVVAVAEVCGLDADGAYDVRDVFKFQHEGNENGRILGQHVRTDFVPSILEEMRISGLLEAVALFQNSA